MNGLHMTSMQRTLTSLGHQEADRVPMFLLTTLHGAKELGLTIEEYFSHSSYVVEGQMRLLKKYRSDCLYPFFYASLETEAWGGETIFSMDGPPNAGEPIITKPADIHLLESPRVADSAVLKKVLETIHELKQRVGDSVPIVGVAISPFSLPVMQMGFENYIRLIYEYPDEFQRLMQLNEAFSIEWANAQLAAGATAICYFDPVSSTTNIPRELYLKTGKQVATRTIGSINGPVATHLASGRALPIMQDLLETGTAVISASALENLAQVKRTVQGKASILGNLNGIEMRRWTASEAEFAVKQTLAEGARGGGFILADNHGEIPWQVPDEVLLSITEALDEWGRYPLEWVDDWCEESTD
ncbi:MAG: uroporphyrinogen decarboxylase family protein [Candidatus Thiodiazotropha taylori]|nr:uroporphyrinogen decarboxylase family protein [Candidatus Thiodiazotropha taylori]